MLVDRLPDGRVVAVDGSPSMVGAARRLLDRTRVEVICSDLLELTLDEPLDAAISTATFHWIADHDLLFRRIRAVLRPGAVFVAQCGGHGNIDRVRRLADRVIGEPAWAGHFTGWPGPWNYATAEDTRRRLEAAGFVVDRCWLEPAPITPPRPREFLETVICAPYLERLPVELRDPFLDAMQAGLDGDPVLDYVRLNWDARAR
ncbi:MAG TPA: methyltransferase domain-containing protein [Solirubrobacteraceae bacterium]|jgi:trans-aconitate 2-methyltransferase|nr:methyltransferase domain-containing protein [Solirubrobacteraceae bacterium]